jgi:hypothetical protein
MVSSTVPTEPSRGSIYVTGSAVCSLITRRDGEALVTLATGIKLFQSRLHHSDKQATRLLVGIPHTVLDIKC